MMYKCNFYYANDYLCGNVVYQVDNVVFLTPSEKQFLRNTFDNNLAFDATSSIYLFGVFNTGKFWTVIDHYKNFMVLI